MSFFLDHQRNLGSVQKVKTKEGFLGTSEGEKLTLRTCRVSTSHLAACGVWISDGCKVAGAVSDRCTEYLRLGRVYWVRVELCCHGNSSFLTPGHKRPEVCMGRMAQSYTVPLVYNYVFSPFLVNSQIFPKGL